MQQIADPRMLVLGYCTEDVMRELEKRSEENQAKMDQGFSDYREAQQAEAIPPSILDRFHSHDCEVTDIIIDQEMVVRLGTDGGFSAFNKITFVAPEIIKQEQGIKGSTWLYNELYHTGDGYEVHVLFYGENMPELIVRCQDILIEEV